MKDAFLEAMDRLFAAEPAPTTEVREDGTVVTTMAVVSMDAVFALAERIEAERAAQAAE